MASDEKSLSLIIPDLFNGLGLDQIPDRLPVQIRDQIRQQACLSRLLERAEVQPVGATGFEHTLVHAIAGENSSISLAWLTRQGEQDEQSEQGALAAQGAWLRVDPVLMQADLDNVVLFGAQALAITQPEADALIAELNTTYADLGWMFEAPDPLRWYLRIPASPRIHCTAIADVMGQGVRDLLPTGEDSLFWHRTLNEIQMLFYQSPVNLVRRDAGIAEINSVWVWGNGTMQAQQAGWSRLWGDDVLIRGLGVACKVKVQPLPDHASAWLDNKLPGNQLMVLSGLQPDGKTDRLSVLQQYEQNWFAPLLAMLRSRELDAVEIWPCNGRVYRVTRSMLIRFWRHSGWQHTK